MVSAGQGGLDRAAIDQRLGMDLIHVLDAGSAILARHPRGVAAGRLADRGAALRVVCLSLWSWAAWPSSLDW